MKIGNEEILTVKEAAAMIGINVTSLHDQLRKGKIHAERFGHQWFFRPEEVERYMNEVAGRGRRGFGNPSHPLHGRQGPGRGKKDKDAA